MKPYSAYKPSGIEWIGEIPEHWSKTRLRYVSTNFDGKRVPLSAEERGALDGDIPYYGATGVIDHVRDYLFDGEYLLVGEDGAPFFIPNKDVAFIARGKFWVNNHAHILKVCDAANISYATHVLNIVDYREYISGSTRDKLIQDELSAIELPFPPLSEQHAIARYLDDKTKKIDTLIERKQRLIELLKEQRTAIINQAVTKGINPNVRMKDSGIEWLGEIPEHWEVKKLKWISKRTDVGIAEAATHAYRDSGVPIVRSTNLKEGKIDTEDILFIDETFAEKNKSKYMRARDLVTVRTGNAGLTAVVPQALDNSQCFTMLITTLDENANPDFYSYFLNTKAGQVHFDLTAWGSAQKNISVPILRDTPIANPPKKEQDRIVEYLDSKLRQIDKYADDIDASINYLQEYRTTLISEVVTGKIDVREWSEGGNDT